MAAVDYFFEKRKQIFCPVKQYLEERHTIIVMLGAAIEPNEELPI